MKRTILSILGPIGTLFVFVGCQSTSQEAPPGYTYEYASEGKHTERRLVRETDTTTYEVAKATGSDVAGPGDYWSSKTVGRRQVRFLVHDVTESAVATTDYPRNICTDCSYHFVTVGKHSERRDFCEVDGRQVDCTKNPPECPMCAKRQQRLTEGVRP
jgi:hypothetical protein